MASDLESVLDDLGVDSAHVVGASMGGMIAQRYALDFDRAASLTLFCTSLGGDDAVPTPPETRARMFDVPEEYDEREAIRYKMAPAVTDEFAEANDDLLADIVDWRLAGDAFDDARKAQAAGVANFDASERLGEIDVPVLVAHGTDDRVLPVENARVLRDGLPDAELERGLLALHEHDNMHECALLSKRDNVAHIRTTIGQTEAMRAIRNHDGYITGPFYIEGGRELWHVGFDHEGVADDALSQLEWKNEFDVVSRENPDLPDLRISCRTRVPRWRSSKAAATSRTWSAKRWNTRSKTATSRVRGRRLSARWPTNSASRSPPSLRTCAAASER